MITLIISTLENVNFGMILGYILSGLEILIVCLTLISFFVPSDTKFGKILSFVLKGLYKSKGYIKDVEEGKDQPSDEDEKEGDNTNEDKSEQN